MIKRILASLEERRRNLKDEDKGFTLIELLVVVIIIGVLAAIAIPIYIGVQDSAKDSAVKSDLTNAKIAVVAYYTNGGTGAPTLGSLANYGYTQSSGVSSASFVGTAPTSSSSTFCITATRSDDVTKGIFSIGDSIAVKSGATC